MLIRPECRYDWSPAADQVIDYNRAVFGIDVILMF